MATFPTITDDDGTGLTGSSLNNALFALIRAYIDDPIPILEALSTDTWTQQFNNLLKNGSFESWSAGVAAAPDGWALIGAGAAIAREATIIRFDEYSAKVTRNGADVNLQQALMTIDADTNAYWRGRTITMGDWVYATVADRARLGLSDGITDTFSAYHTGGSSWEWLTVTKTLAAGATAVYSRCLVSTGDTAAYFDGAILVEGTICPTFCPNPVDWGDNIPNIIAAAPTDVGKIAEIRFYRSGTTRRIYMCDGTDWKYQAIAT